MTSVDHTTGEIMEFDSAAAERRAERISLRLDAIADNYARVLPMIREAIEKRDDIALGYRSPGDYVSDRFGQSLAGLGIEVRRAVVGELTQAGLSTRAIAPIVGASQQIVQNDRKVTNRLSPVSSEPTPDGWTSAPSPGPVLIEGYLEGPQDEPANPSAAGVSGSQGEGDTPPKVAPQVALSPRPAITGIDGKTYAPPKPRTLRVVHAQSEDDQAVELVETIARNLTVLSQVTVPERREALIKAWPKALGRVSPAQTDRFTPERMRAVADGLHDLADEWSN